MSRSQIPAALRRQVIARAGSVCEYCLIHEDDTYFGCEIDHIVSEKHGGAATRDNLALACLYCNRNKGSDIASFVPGTERLVRFYNPRASRWLDQFRLGSDGVWIVALTDTAEATVRVLRMNDGERLMERDTLREVGRYPTPAAIARMSATD